MPFPMVHMCIARKVIELNPNTVKDLPQYYLGSLAPDAVHFRTNFEPKDKKVTHLCVGDERWGEISNNEDWASNVINFIDENRDSENMDFIYGYCIHILTDMRSNVDFWSPFKLKFYNSLKIPDYGSLYDSEAINILNVDDIYADIRLYQTSEFQSELWDILSKANGITLDGIAYEDEINKIRDNILYNQYKDKSIDKSYVGKFITYEDYLNFIDKTAKIITGMLFS